MAIRKIGNVLRTCGDIRGGTLGFVSASSLRCDEGDFAEERGICW
jgi:hypothetical protein